MDAFNFFIYLCIMKNNALRGAIVCLTLFAQTVFAQNLIQPYTKEKPKMGVLLKKDTIYLKKMPQLIALRPIAVPVVTISKTGKIVALSPRVVLPKSAPVMADVVQISKMISTTKIGQAKTVAQQIAPPKTVAIKPSSSKIGSLVREYSKNNILTIPPKNKAVIANGAERSEAIY